MHVLLANIFTKIYNITTCNSIFCITYSHQLANPTKKLNNMNKIFHFNNLSNNIGIKDMHKIIKILFIENKNKLNVQK